jgi:hypothetical protein
MKTMGKGWPLKLGRKMVPRQKGGKNGLDVSHIKGLPGMMDLLMMPVIPLRPM